MKRKPKRDGGERSMGGENKGQNERDKEGDIVRKRYLRVPEKSGDTKGP